MNEQETKAAFDRGEGTFELARVGPGRWAFNEAAVRRRRRDRWITIALVAVLIFVSFARGFGWGWLIFRRRATDGPSLRVPPVDLTDRTAVAALIRRTTITHPLRLRVDERRD